MLPVVDDGPVRVCVQMHQYTDRKARAANPDGQNAHVPVSIKRKVCIKKALISRPIYNVRTINKF